MISSTRRITGFIPRFVTTPGPYGLSYRYLRSWYAGKPHVLSGRKDWRPMPLWPAVLLRCTGGMPALVILGQPPNYGGPCNHVDQPAEERLRGFRLRRAHQRSGRDLARLRRARLSRSGAPLLLAGGEPDDPQRPHGGDRRSVARVPDLQSDLHRRPGYEQEDHAPPPADGSRRRAEEVR